MEDIRAVLDESMVRVASLVAAMVERDGRP
jgi:hypothetical protein